MKKIFFFTSSRSDFGIQLPLIKKFSQSKKFKTYTIITGSHFDKKFGYSFNEKTSVYTNFGKTYRVPTYTDLYYSDRTTLGNSDLEPESAISSEFGFKYNSKQIVFKTFLFGCATILGIDLVIPVLDNFSEANFKGETYYFFDSFIRAGFVEEIFKAMVLVFYCTRKSAFDEPMDGIIYGVAVSLGYAAYENIAYIEYFSKETSLIDISLVRAFSAVPMHGLCGVMMGFLITLSIFEKKHNKQTKGVAGQLCFTTKTLRKK